MVGAGVWPNATLLLAVKVLTPPPPPGGTDEDVDDVAEGNCQLVIPGRLVAATGFLSA